MPDQANALIDSLELGYARALFEMAQAHNQLDDIGRELAELADLLRQQSDLGRLLASRKINVEERAQSIERIFKGNVSDLLYRFMQVANKKDRLARLADIARAYQHMLDEHHGVVQARAYVAELMDIEKAGQVAAELGTAMGKQVQLKQEVDPSLIGGLKLRIGDRLIDGSIATRLRLIEQRLVSRGRDEARRTVAQSQ